MKKSTLADIAQVLDVSVSTVYRALSNEGRIKPETKEQVLRTAQEIGYRPNILARSLSSKKEAKIAVLCPKDIFFSVVIDGIKSAEEEYRDFGLHIEFFHTDVCDVVKQSMQLKEVCNTPDYSGVAIMPAHPLLLNPMIEQLVEAGIPVLTFCNDAPQSKRFCFIGQNAFMAGKICAQLFKTLLADRGIIALMTSFSSALAVKMRRDGFKQYICNDSNIEIIGPFEYYDDIQNAYEICTQIIQNNNINGVYPNNMMGSIGCARAIKDSGNKGKIFLIGYDQNEEIEKYIKEDIIYASILQDPFSQGYYSIKVLMKMFTGVFNSKEDKLHTKCDILIKSNIDDYEDHNLLYKI